MVVTDYMCAQVSAASTEGRYESDRFTGRTAERPLACDSRKTTTEITWSGSFHCCWSVRGDYHDLCYYLQSWSAVIAALLPAAVTKFYSMFTIPVDMYFRSLLLLSSILCLD